MKVQGLLSMFHTDSKSTRTKDQHFVIIAVLCSLGCTGKEFNVKVCKIAGLKMFVL